MNVSALLTCPQAARRLRVSVWTVRGWWRRRMLAGTMLGGRLLIAEDSLASAPKPARVGRRVASRATRRR